MTGRPRLRRPSVNKKRALDLLAYAVLVTVALALVGLLIGVWAFGGPEARMVVEIIGGVIGLIGVFGAVMWAVDRLWW